MAKVTIVIEDAARNATSDVTFEPSLLRDGPQTQAQRIGLRVLDYLTSCAGSVQAAGPDGILKTLRGNHRDN